VGTRVTCCTASCMARGPLAVSANGGQMGVLLVSVVLHP
jgi:hypothetical protein